MSADNSSQAAARRRSLIWLLVWALAALVVAAVTPAGAYEGFGASTPGGAGGAVVRVTTLESSGPGSLRAALAAGHRHVVFDVAGDIHLDDHLYVKGPFVTIDGFSAPWPGITVRNRGLIIRGSEGAHDVIVRGLRVRDASIDGIQVAYGAYNVVIDHVSVSGSGDGNIDITDSHDVTVSWSILANAQSRHAMLIKYSSARVSLHHNLFANTRRQSPDVALDDAFRSAALDTTVDMRNNLIWNWGDGFGTKIHASARANVVANLYANPGAPQGDQYRAIVVCTVDCDEPPSPTRAHVSSNASVDAAAFSINNALTDGAPFPAPRVPTEDACLAVRRILGAAGVHPRDGLDEATLAGISMPWCPALFVKGLTYEAMRRNTSDAEVQAWLDALGERPSAWDVWAVVRAAFEGPEARALPVTPSGYIAAAYRAAHGHAPEPETVAFYTGQLLDHWNAMVPALLASSDSAATEASTSPGAVVGRLYQEALGRSPSADENSAWTDYLATTGDVSGVARAFLASDEYTTRPRTLDQHVTIVYRAVLGRSPGELEVAGWVEYLATRLPFLAPRDEDVAAFVDRSAQLFP